MLALEFRNIAREIGGNIESIKFSSPPRRQSNIPTVELRTGVLRLPDKR